MNNIMKQVVEAVSVRKNEQYPNGDMILSVNGINNNGVIRSSIGTRSFIVAYLLHKNTMMPYLGDYGELPNKINTFKISVSPQNIVRDVIGVHSIDKRVEILFNSFLSFSFSLVRLYFFLLGFTRVLL